MNRAKNRKQSTIEQFQVELPAAKRIMEERISERVRFRKLIVLFARKYEEEYRLKIPLGELLQRVSSYEWNWDSCIKRFLEGKSFAMKCALADIDDGVEGVFMEKSFEESKLKRGLRIERKRRTRARTVNLH